MSSRRLQDVFSVRILRLPRRLARCLQDVLKDEKSLRWRRVEDVFKTNKCLLTVKCAFSPLIFYDQNYWCCSLQKPLKILAFLHFPFSRYCHLKIFSLFTWSPEAYSEPCQLSKMERFMKVVNDFQTLTNFTKGFILMFGSVLDMPLAAYGESLIKWQKTRQNLGY